MCAIPGEQPGSTARIQRDIHADYFCSFELRCCGLTRVAESVVKYPTPDSESFGVKLLQRWVLERKRSHKKLYIDWNTSS